MVGVLAVGFVANLLIRPVAAKFHEPKAAVDAFTTPSTTEASVTR